MEIMDTDFDDNAKLIIKELTEANENFEKVIKKLQQARNKFIKKHEPIEALKTSIKNKS